MLYLQGHDSETPMVANDSLFLVLFDYGGERGRLPPDAEDSVSLTDISHGWLARQCVFATFVSMVLIEILRDIEDDMQHSTLS